MIYAPDDTGRRIQLSAAKARAPSSRACLLALRIYCNRIAAVAQAEVDPTQERTATALQPGWCKLVRNGHKIGSGMPKSA
jgi:hypothetical protein